MKLLLLTVLFCCFCFASFSQQKNSNFTIKMDNPNSKNLFHKDTSFTLNKEQLKKMLAMDSLYSNKKGIRAYVSNKNCSNMPVLMVDGNVSNMPTSSNMKKYIYAMPVIKTDSVNIDKGK